MFNDLTAMLLGTLGWNKFVPSEKRQFPPLDAYTINNGETAVIEAALAGFKKEDVEIKIERDYLIISGTNPDNKESSEEFEKNKPSYFHKSLRKEDFSVAIRLDGRAWDSDNCEATFENGLLKIVLQKAEDFKGTNIKIK